MNIPAGVEDGTRIRLAGEGEAGVRGGPPGDLYIFLSMAAHPFFQRDGADLHCRVPVSMVTAALGGDFEVPTIDGGKTRVKVPEGTQSGRRLRLQAKACRCCGPARAATCMCRSWSKPRRNYQEAARTSGRVRPAVVGGNAAEIDGIFGKVKEFIDGLGSKSTTSA